ncbi:hypothetical protein TIFTF001_009466 [Ficus carica]|uniref:Uncharacterized protein n=1 Tax=Ficus carica TaxID=3494 RepID=A0AA87ZVB5_FICCA|nr:hypothetical protein TIFTF001_009466 [Ficus carica]
MGSNDRLFSVVSCNVRGEAGAGAGADADAEAEAALGPAEEEVPSDCTFVNRRSFSRIHRFCSVQCSPFSL